MSAIAAEATAFAAAPHKRRGKGLVRWFLTRIIGAIGVLWATATVTFILQAIASKHRAFSILEQETGTQALPSKAAMAAVNKKFAFDHSQIHQYLTYIWQLVHLNLGVSYFQQEPVLKIITAQITPTIVLAATSMVLAWLIATTVTVIFAGRRNVWSRLASGFQIFTAALPQYWLGSLLLVIFALKLGLFPVQGGSAIDGLVLPAFTLALPLAGFLGQVIHDEFVRTLEQPFVMSSRARGMSDIRVRVRHVLRHSVLPGLTLSGWAVGYLFSGAVLVETVFDRAGIGSVLVSSTNEGDVPVVNGIVLASAALYIVVNLIVDFGYTVVDPRLKVQ